MDHKKIVFLWLFSFVIYFGFGTKWTGKIRQELDHYNYLAHSFREGRLDIQNTPVLDELSYFNGKWYPFYGPLPAIPIGLLQILSEKEFIPTLYPNAAVAALGVVVTYLLLLRFKKNYYSKTTLSPLLMTSLLAFGTVYFWLATRSGIWFQVQIYTYLFTGLGLWSLLVKKRTRWHYFSSVLFFSINLFTRPHTVILLVVPLMLYLTEKKKYQLKNRLIIGAPLIAWLLVFFTYNFARFGNILETGIHYQQIHYRFANRYAKSGGWFSLINIPYNLWFMALETPVLTWEDGFTPIQKIRFTSNPEGNSIFFMTPPLLAIFLAQPWKEKVRARRGLSYALWVGVVLTLVPILMLFGTGWQQLGYRYTLDVTALLLLLMILGIRGKPNLLFYLGTVFSIWIWTLGVMTT